MKKGKNKNEKAVIHNVHLLDASGSMAGAKYANAIEGINTELASLKKNDEVIYTQTIVEFDSMEQNSERITEHYFMEPIENCKAFKGRGAEGNTPLYQAAGYLIEKLLRKVRHGERVILTIFTDGYHNCNWGKYGHKGALNELIADAQENHNFTITFMGTKEDTQKVVQDLGISWSNTMSHTNTPDSISKAYKSRGMSLTSYSSSVANEDLMSTQTFFTNTGSTSTTTTTTTNPDD